MLAFFGDAFKFGVGIVLGGVAGFVADNVLGLFAAWAVFVSQWSTTKTAFVGSVLGTLLISLAGWVVSYFIGQTLIPSWDLTPAVVMLSAFTAMPNYRGMLKSLVEYLSAPINTEIDALLEK